MRKVVIAAAFGLALVSPVDAQQSVKIGLLMPLTGNAASAGQQSKAAVELGAEIVNSAHPELGALPLAASTGLPNLNGAKIEIVMGDARLSLAAEAPQRYDVLVIDAFSGDAIPVHLLTTQALDLYRRHLQPNGIVAFHVSNRFLDRFEQ